MNVYYLKYTQFVSVVLQLLNPRPSVYLGDFRSSLFNGVHLYMYYVGTYMYNYNERNTGYYDEALVTYKYEIWETTR